MAVSGVASTTSTTQTTATNSSTSTGLDKNAFLKLLITELANQDPLNPMEDREFISQMATFSTLEEMQNMNSTLTTVADSMRFSATSYIGKAVSFMVTAGEGDDAVSQQTAGIVNAVWFENGKTILDTTAGQISLDEVLGVMDVEG